jgi:hypothetical protein
MRKILLIPVIALAALGVEAPGATADETRRFEFVSTTMTGAEEVPAVDTEARGHAAFVIDRERETIRYAAVAYLIDGVTESHVHLAPSGQNGPAVVFLFDFDDVPLNVATAEEGTRRGFVAAGVITEDDLLDASLTFDAFVGALTTGGAYVNVHTLDFRGGEIRGQID